MIAQLFKFELIYQRKQWALPAAMILFFLSGLQIGGQGFAPDMVNYNAPYQISYYTSIFTLGSVFAIMFFVISGILRDSSHDMESIVFSTGIRKYQFFWSRFLGVFVFSLLSVTPLVIGMITGTHLFDLDPERLSPFSLTPYLKNWLVFVVPNVFICSAFIFSVGLFSRNRMAIYASSVLVYVLYFVSSFFFNSPILADSTPTHTDNMMLAALGDPFGISAFMEQSMYLTPLQKNEVIVSLTSNFLLNRLLWIGISLAVLGITYRLFSFRTVHRKKASSPDSKEELPNTDRDTDTSQPVNVNTSGNIAFWSGFASQSRIGVKQLLKSLPFQVILVLVAFIFSSEFYTRLIEGGSYSESLYPVTSLLAGMNNTAVFIFSVLPIIFFSGEWVWKERSENMHLILDATPVSNTSIFLSKLMVLLCIPALIITLEIIIAVIFQLLLGYPLIDMGMYLSLYYFQGLPLVFCILLALLVQSLSPGKYMGMAVTGMLIIVGTTPLSGTLGLEHPLFRMGSVPDVTFSDMSGVSNSASAFYLLSTHWMLLGLIFSLISLQSWQRGIGDRFVIHIRQSLKNWSPKHLTGLAVLIMAFLATSGMIFYKTNIEEDYLSSEKALDQLEQFERSYKHYEDVPWLYPVSIKTEMAMYPLERSYTVDATYILENKSDSAVNKMLITEKKPTSDIHLENATLTGQDSLLGVFEYAFDTPVQPGETVQLSFSVDGHHTGLYNGNDLVDNGSYVHLRDFSPFLGYSTSMEISDNSERRKRGLPGKEPETPSDADFDLMESGFGRVDFETILSVPEGQTGLSIGNLDRQWTENDRNYYRFVSDIPVAPTITYHSGDYITTQETYDGISLEHYYYAGHDLNEQTILNSMKQTLDYAQREFGDYPFDHLRIVELPSFWGFGGYAPAGTIGMVEDNLYLVDERDPEAFSLVAKRTIHEVAHQWWGHQLSTQNVSGGAIFIEGFAKYTEAVVMEQHYGMPSLFQLAESANRTYFNGRSYASTPEQPLYLEQGQQYMLYGKSYIVLYALKELIGEDKVNQVLRTLVNRHKHEVDATVTSPEFLDDLYAVTPEEHHSLIDDWFKKIITYDLSVEEVTYSRQPDGMYEVTFTIDASRSESVEGIESPVTINEPVPIGAFGTHPSRADGEHILLLEAFEITDGSQQITIRTETLPRYISIDPYGTRPDLVRSDNWIRVER